MNKEKSWARSSEFCDITNMLEAQISLRHQGETHERKRGDVIVLRLAGFPWSDYTLRRFLIVTWNDPEILSELNNQFMLGVVHPIRTLPYSVRKVIVEADEFQGQETKMTNRSTRMLDFNNMSARLKTDALDQQKELLLRSDQYRETTDASDRTAE